MMSKQCEIFDVRALLEQLRWKADMLITNDFGDRVWLKELYDKNNKRIGITDCCFQDDPCEWHKAIAKHHVKLGTMDSGNN